jgi:heat shock protein HspQ
VTTVSDFQEKPEAVPFLELGHAFAQLRETIDLRDEPLRAKFNPGQLILHKKFAYRGVIVDVDAIFSGTDEWYEQVARSRPPKNAPWYHVLVNDAAHMTYVAERNLDADSSIEPINHPLLEQFFDCFEAGEYSRRKSLN